MKKVLLERFVRNVILNKVFFSTNKEFKREPQKNKKSIELILKK